MVIDISDVGNTQAAMLLSALAGHICSLSAKEALCKKCSGTDISCQTCL
jgi:hypothetical protein